jgi:hypothetical protein
MAQRVFLLSAFVLMGITWRTLQTQAAAKNAPTVKKASGSADVKKTLLGVA